MKVLVFITTFLTLSVTITVAHAKQPTSVHEEHSKSFQQLDHPVQATAQQRYPGDHQLSDRVQIFGWHPHWKGEAYKNYNFSLLSIVAYFSYELDPATGKAHSIHDWNTTGLIEAAHQKGCKVLLAVTSFGKDNNHQFLHNLTAQAHFIANVKKLSKARGANGIAIDFEGVAHDDATHLTRFVAQLSTQLKASQPDALVALALPGIDHHQSYDTARLDPSVDLFVVMTYNYYGSFSQQAGPVAPLHSGDIWHAPNVKRSIKHYRDAGIDAAKLLLGVAYYGARWATESVNFPAKATHFKGHQSYAHIKTTHQPTPSFDPDSQTAYYSMTTDQADQAEQLWFDDIRSLSLKYNFVNDQQLGGVAIWALGYDAGQTELWKLLKEKFTNAGVGRARLLLSLFFVSLLGAAIIVVLRRR